MRLAGLVLLVVSLATSAAAEIVVGVAGPMSGRFAEQGAAIRKGVEEAVAQLGATQKGLPGETLRVVVVDDRCEAKAGVEAARALIAQKAAVVIGHTCASAALAAAPVYAAAQTLLLALTRHPDLTDKRAGPTIFRMAGRDDRQAEAITEYLLKSAQNKRIALVHDRTQYAKRLIEQVYKGLGPAGIAPVLMETIVASEKDYKALAGRIRQSGADVLVFGGYPPEAMLLQSNLETLGAAPALIGGDALAETVVAGKLRALFPRPPESSLELFDRQWTEIASAYRGTPGVEVNRHLASIAVGQWLDAATASKTYETGRIVQQLSDASQPRATPVLWATGRAAMRHGMVLRGPAGARFDQKGDADTRSYRIYKSVDGKLSPAD